MDKFPEAYNLPRLNHGEIENLNRPMGKEIVSVIKKSPNKDKMTSLVISTKHLKKN